MDSQASSPGGLSPAPRHQCTHARVSVVLATLGQRVEPTRRTLQALGRQGCSNCEVIVVLNGEGSAEFERMVGEFPARLIQTPTPGQSRAQNLGIRGSDGPIVAFTDDDVVPHDDWLHQLVGGFTGLAIGCVTGRCELANPGILRRSTIYSERALSRWTLSPDDPDWVDKALRSDTGVAANHAFSRDALFEIGLMPEDLSGGAAIDTVEGELYLQVVHHGRSIHHNPDAIVELYFDDPPEVQKERLHGTRGAMVALYVKLLLEDRGQAGLRWRIFKSLLASVRRVLARKPEPALPGEVRLSRTQTCAAYLYGLVLYWRSRSDTARARQHSGAAEQARDSART